ncbi:unnamed protein product [Closterium sp. NIES-65]|nr:unnamed protein product [Closterium sp. NIES-65]
MLKSISGNVCFGFDSISGNLTAKAIAIPRQALSFPFNPTLPFHPLLSPSRISAVSCSVAISEAPKLQFLREEGRQHSGTVGRRPIRSQGGDGGGREGWGRGGGGGGGGEEVAGVEGWEGRAMELLLLLVEERVEHLMGARQVRSDEFVGVQVHDRAMEVLLLLVEVRAEHLMGARQVRPDEFVGVQVHGRMAG